MLAKMLDYAAPTLREIAHDVGISYHAIRSYRNGDRTPSPKVLRRLAAVLVARGGELRKLGRQLERQVTSRDRGPQPRGKA